MIVAWGVMKLESVSLVTRSRNELFVFWNSSAFLKCYLDIASVSPFWGIPRGCTSWSTDAVRLWPMNQAEFEHLIPHHALDMPKFRVASSLCLASQELLPTR